MLLTIKQILDLSEEWSALDEKKAAIEAQLRGKMAQIKVPQAESPLFVRINKKLKTNLTYDRHLLFEQIRNVTAVLMDRFPKLQNLHFRSYMNEYPMYLAYKPSVSNSIEFAFSESKLGFPGCNVLAIIARNDNGIIRVKSKRFCTVQHLLTYVEEYFNET